MESRSTEKGAAVAREVTDTVCYLCGSKPPAGEVLGVDRLDNDAGYIQGNCLPCCQRCIKAKGAFSLPQFLMHVAKMDAHMNKKSPGS
jgi:hypothetical protein